MTNVYQGGEVNVHQRICMRHLGNHRRGNPLADWLCNFQKEEVKLFLGGKKYDGKGIPTAPGN